jgi:hypothetical protein
MAYVTPPTFTPGTELAADDLNLLGDDIKYLKAQTDQAVLSGCVVTRAASQSIPNNTATLMSFTAEVIDAGGWIAVTSTTVTVPAGAIPAGYTTIAVDCRISATFATNATGYRRATLLKNGTPVVGPVVDAGSGQVTVVSESCITTAVAGDTFTVEVQQTSGGSLNVTAGLTVVVFKPVS